MLANLMVLLVFSQAHIISEKSSVNFQVKNLGFSINGTVGGISGTVQNNTYQPEKSVFILSAKSETINTNNNLRDGHLKGQDYFDVKHFPVMTFESVKTMIRNNRMNVVGNLSIKGHQKEISIPVIVTKTDSETTYSGRFSINRRDFAIGGFSTISDEVTISFLLVTNNDTSTTITK